MEYDQQAADMAKLARMQSRELDKLRARVAELEASLQVAMGAAVVVRGEAEKQHARAERAEAERDNAINMVRRLRLSWSKFARIVREGDGAIPTDRLSFHDWHEATKMDDEAQEWLRLRRDDDHNARAALRGESKP